LRLVAATAALLLAGPALAAEPPPGFGAEVKRAIAAVGSFGTEAPAVRREAAERPPSAGFLLGAALAAWTNAAAQLAFDLENPQAAGPAHAHLDQEGADLLRQECAEEATAFIDLQARTTALGMSPQDVAALAGADPGAWLAREGAGPAEPCR
jgi:hypothetical protein